MTGKKPYRKVLKPRVKPEYGMKVVSWETVPANPGFCHTQTLTPRGWFWVILLLFVCPPLLWIPCTKESMHVTAFRPIYGFPGKEVKKTSKSDGNGATGASNGTAKSDQPPSAPKTE